MKYLVVSFNRSWMFLANNTQGKEMDWLQVFGGTKKRWLCLSNHPNKQQQIASTYQHHWADNSLYHLPSWAHSLPSEASYLAVMEVLCWPSDPDQVTAAICYWVSQWHLQILKGWWFCVILFSASPSGNMSLSCQAWDCVFLLNVLWIDLTNMYLVASVQFLCSTLSSCLLLARRGSNLVEHENWDLECCIELHLCRLMSSEVLWAVRWRRKIDVLWALN